MKKDDLDQNYAKYLNNLKTRGYEHLPSPLKVPTIDDLAAEGAKLLEEEGVKDLPPSTPAKENLEMALGKNSKNPYVRARVKVLSDMPTTRRERILKLEVEKNLDHPDYKDFVKMVRKLGDEYESKENK